MADRDADRTRPDAGSTRSDDAREARGVQQQAGGHGQSVASWTAVGTIIFGSLVATLAVVFALIWLFVVGVVVIVVGAILGKVLHGMGFGENAHDLPPNHPKQGVR